MGEYLSTSLQLSLGGVAFTLIPEDPKGTVTFCQQHQQEQQQDSENIIMLQLSNFSGTLRVHVTPKSRDSVATAIEKSSKVNQITPKQRPSSHIDNSPMNTTSSPLNVNKRARLDDELTSHNSSSIEEVSNRFSNNLLGQPDLSQTQPTLSGNDDVGEEEEDHDDKEDDRFATPEQIIESSHMASHFQQRVDEPLQMQQQNKRLETTKYSASVQNDSTNVTIVPLKNSIPIRTLPVEKDSSPNNSKQQPSNIPCPRWGHTMTCIGPNRLLVYGGQSIVADELVTLDDLHIWDGTRWIQPLNNHDGMKRQWHTATYLPERQLLIAVGGEVIHHKNSKSKVVSDHPVMVLDTEIMLWYPPSVSGDIPKGRSGHTATLLGHELVVWGGVSSNKFLQRVSILDTLRWVWYTPTVHGTAPRPRSYHTAIAFGKASSSSSSQRMLVFGGNDGDQCFNSVHILERSKNKDTTSTTTATSSTSSSTHWEWSNVQTTGTIPSPRTGHSAVLLKDGTTICIYGGWDPNGGGSRSNSDDDDEEEEDDTIFGDSFLLDTDTWIWTKGPWNGVARVGHGAVVQSDGIVVFGGRCPGDDVFSNDVLMLDWTQS